MKFLSLIFGFMLFMSIQTKAQVITTFTGSDTIVNTATVNCDLILRNAYTSGVFQVVNTKVSGTVAGNTLFQGSVDGTNYVTLDTLVNTDQTTNTKIIVQTPPTYPYYRFKYTGSGTMSAIMVAKAHFKK
jgi:hypothetical protein